MRYLLYLENDISLFVCSMGTYFSLLAAAQAVFVSQMTLTNVWAIRKDWLYQIKKY